MRTSSFHPFHELTHRDRIREVYEQVNMVRHSTDSKYIAPELFGHRFNVPPQPPLMFGRNEWMALMGRPHKLNGHADHIGSPLHPRSPLLSEGHAAERPLAEEF